MRAALEVWAGLECTLNRVGDRQHDQLARAGHYLRADDADRIAALGVTTVRYPILWERMEANVPEGRAWEWTDERLAQWRTLGVDPIAGLMHHGSGPSGTSLLDPAFPERFAAYAARVAARYPWLTRYTPVNEPLTTARFSALYGHWYPHARDDQSFLRALLNQVRATRLAMEAIRRVNPGALLIQTEDLGYTHATPALVHQAAFENERRWLSFDLLCGRVKPGHPLWSYIRGSGISAADVERAVGDGCTPDMLGINHYVTSERWLDERVDRYPASTHGGNGTVRYSDVEAVRAVPGGVVGAELLLRQAWERYALPMAITEAHMGCTREQQLQWLAEMWRSAGAARASGADVRAVTAWAAFGTYDWCSLVTTDAGAYEPGLFDTRSTPPRPTALAAMTQALATTGTFTHPALDGTPWWRESARLLYDVGDPASGRGVKASATTRAGRPVLVTGASGTLGSAFVRQCAARGLRCVAAPRSMLDITSYDDVAQLIDASAAWAVVNAAGYVHVDDAEWNADECRRANTDGPEVLARACAARGLAMATFSSDLVFDGTAGHPYVESDPVAPLGVYGAAKADGEERVLLAAPQALVVRTAWFFGPNDQWNFLTASLQRIARGVPAEVPDDLVVSPTWVPHLVDAVLDLLVDGERDVWHLASAGGGRKVVDIVRDAAGRAGLDPSLVHGRPHWTLGMIAPRPPAAVLASERGAIMPSLDRALDAYVACRTWEEGRVPTGTVAVTA